MDLKEVVKGYKNAGTKVTVFNNSVDAMVYALKFAQYGREEYKKLIGRLLDKDILYHDKELIVVDKFNVLG